MSVTAGVGGAGGGQPRCGVDDGSPEHIIAISAGRTASLALSSRGRVACWGQNSYRQCGRASSGPSVYGPLWIPDLACMRQVDTNLLGLAIDDAGVAWSWGTEFVAELGDGVGTSGEFGAPVRVLVPGPVTRIGSNVVGGRAVVNGQTWLWGSMFDDRYIHTPVAWDVPAGTEVFHTGAVLCALTGDGRARCAGRNSSGALGDGTLEDREELADVATDVRFTTMAFGAYFTCGITVGGDVYCWGGNREASLGIGTMPPLTAPEEESAVPTPTRLPGLSGITSIDLAEAGGCALDAAGDVYCWGRNRWERFAARDVDYLLSPQRISDLSPAVAVALGDDHVCALRDDATVWCRGPSDLRGSYDGLPDEATPVTFPFDEEP